MGSMFSIHARRNINYPAASNADYLGDDILGNSKKSRGGIAKALRGDGGWHNPTSIYTLR